MKCIFCALILKKKKEEKSTFLDLRFVVSKGHNSCFTQTWHKMLYFQIQSCRCWGVYVWMSKNHKRTCSLRSRRRQTQVCYMNSCVHVRLQPVKYCENDVMNPGLHADNDSMVVFGLCLGACALKWGKLFPRGGACNILISSAAKGSDI